MEFDRSYFIIFKFLDYYYFNYFNVNYEENKKGFLGGMLGAMSPENEFIGGIADISYYNKWVEIKEKYFSGGNYLECLLKYAEFYIEEFGFEFLIPVMSFVRTAGGAEKLTEIAEDFSVS